MSVWNIWQSKGCFHSPLLSSFIFNFPEFRGLVLMTVAQVVLAAAPNFWLPNLFVEVVMCRPVACAELGTCGVHADDLRCILPDPSSIWLIGIFATAWQWLQDLSQEFFFAFPGDTRD